VTAAIRDGGGTVLVPGPVPNPWVFVTIPEPCCWFYLPLILRG
jgi:hypothetical protein